MSEENEALVRSAYEAYGQGDVTRLLELVHPDLEWTYLDPGFAESAAAGLPRAGPAGVGAGPAG